MIGESPSPSSIHLLGSAISPVRGTNVTGDGIHGKPQLWRFRRSDDHVAVATGAVNEELQVTWSCP